MNRAPILALALLAACPAAGVAPTPAPPAAPPTAVATWLDCASQLGFEARQLALTAPGQVAIELRTPAIFTLAAHDRSDRDDRDDRDVAALRWFTPLPPGRWQIGIGVAVDGRLVLESFAPGSFLDAQRLLVVERRCGPLAVGDAVRRAYAEGPPEQIATRSAARLTIAECDAGERCPEGWRERLLQLAAVHPDAAPTRFERDCGAPRPPDPHDGGSAARDLRAWVVDEVGPAPGISAVTWAKQLSARALGGGESVIRPRFDALLATGDPGGAARLVDEALAEELGISERLRFDGALAWKAAGDLEAARARLASLGEDGRTAYADFARRELETLTQP